MIQNLEKYLEHRLTNDFLKTDEILRIHSYTTNFETEWNRIQSSIPKSFTDRLNGRGLQENNRNSISRYDLHMLTKRGTYIE